MLLKKVKFDLLGITESKLTNKIRDEKRYHDYREKIFRKDRPVDRGWRRRLCAILCQKFRYCFSLILLPYKSKYTLETIWLELKFHSQNLAFSIMYRPPKDTNFFVMMERQLDCICKKKKNILIMDDLNSNVFRNKRHEAVANVIDSNQGRKLTNTLRKFALTNIIKEPRRITETAKVVKAGVFEICIADHRLIYTALK